VNGVRRLSDGRIVVANGGSAQLRFYSEHGEFLTSAGRRGRGPGEFSYLASLLRITNDTLIVQGGGRVLVFGPNGEYIRQRAVQTAGMFQQPYFSEGGEVLHDGTLLLRVYENRRDRPPGRYRPGLGFVRFNPDTNAQDTLGWYLGIEHELVGDDARWLGFSPSTEMTYSADRVFVGDSKRFEIFVYGYDGTLLQIVRGPGEPAPVTEELKADFRRMFLDRVSADPTQQRNMPYYERTMAELPWAETVPAFSTLATDSEGNLWVGAYEVSQSFAPTQWMVFNDEGEWVTEVVVPARFRLLDIGSDYLLGVWTDDVDVEHVRMHRLMKRSC
jgi:hypothetical protein